MLKYIELNGVGRDNEPLTRVVTPTDSFVKEASDSDLHPDVAEYISSIKPDNGKLYVLINALGAGEFYGSNSNGDYFKEEDLIKEAEDKGYKSFLNAGIYRHHSNKDKEKSMGRVAFVIYNKKMKRVELVAEIDRKKAKELGHGDLLKDLDAGKTPSTSMGCKVKYDVCSICNNKAKKRSEYCEHIKEKGMNHILPDGRKVYVVNPDPRFFDISLVVFGADKTSRAMSKLASGSNEPSAVRAERYSLPDPDVMEKNAQDKTKLAALLKKIPGLMRKIDPSIVKEKALPSKILKKLASMGTMDEILTTAASVGIVLRPDEFQWISLTKLGHKKSADLMMAKREIFSPVEGIDKIASFDTSTKVSSAILSELAEFVPSRSAFEPFITKRVLIKEGSANTLPVSNGPLKAVSGSSTLDAISAAYNGYRVALLEKAASISDAAKSSLDIQVALSEDLLEDRLLGRSKTAGLGGATAALMGLFPLAYIYGAYVRTKRGAGKEVSKVDNFIEKHPAFSASMAMGLGRLGMVLAKRGDLRRGLSKALSGL